MGKIILSFSMSLDIIPVLFGGGMRPFEMLDAMVPQLEKIWVVELPVRTHIRFRVVK